MYYSNDVAFDKVFGAMESPQNLSRWILDNNNIYFEARVIENGANCLQLHDNNKKYHNESNALKRWVMN